MSEKLDLKKILIIATYIILLIAVVIYITPIINFIGTIVTILKPLWIGIAIAFVLNIIMSFYEKLLTKKEKKIDGKILKKKELKHKRLYAMLLTFATVILFITLILIFVIPQIGDSIARLIGNMPGYMETMKQYILDLKTQFSIPDETVNSVIEYFNQIIPKITNSIESWIPEAFKFTQGIANGVVNFIIALVLAIYMLASKEKLCGNIKRVIKAFMKEKVSNYIIKVGTTFNKTFRGFIAGQLTEAMIIAILCYIGMLIFRMEYAVLISVIIGITAIIPYFGGFIGSIPSAFILCMISPMMAIGFLVFIFTLQMIEGNIIYPRVVGTSIGISGFWILIAITIGTSVGGLLGILIGIPTFAAIYILLKEIITKREKIS